MKLNEYLTENGVKLMIKGSGENYPPRQTNDLGMYDYAEGLENVIGKMAWIYGAHIAVEINSRAARQPHVTGLYYG